MVERNRRGGRFFGRRVNLEFVPLLPAGAVRWVLDDPRKIPYLLVWRRGRDGEAKDAIRVAQCGDPGPFFGNNREFFRVRGTCFRCSWITTKRPDGRGDFLRAIWRPLARNGAHDLFLVCPGCDIPRRYLYGWEAEGRFTNSAAASRWQCRSCARLRYSSEGGALVLRGRTISRLLRYPYHDLSSPRPESWLPYVLTSIHDPRLDEMLRKNRP
jgi:hypothetical protein